MKQTVFCVLLTMPLRKIRQVEVDIRVCEKWTWAVEANGKRHLLGTSAFFTASAAERCKLGLLRQMASSSALAYVAPHVFKGAVQQLRDYRDTGAVH